MGRSFELRLSDIGLPRARLSTAFAVAHFNGDEIATDGDAPIVVEDSVGVSGTAIVEWPFTGGRYKVGIQYGRGAAYDFRSTLGPPPGRTFAPGDHVHMDDLWQFRVVSDLLVDERGPWQLQGIAVYQDLDNGAAANNRVRWVSLGARPVYKLTVAPQITPTLKFLSRPSLRAFATWAHWSDSLRGSVAPMAYPTSVQGTAFGVQLESWW